MQKEIDEDGAGVGEAYKERYLYDIPGAGGFSNILQVYRQDGSNDPYLERRLLHGPAVDQILAEEQYDAPGSMTSHDDPLTEEGKVLWTLTDNLGTVRDIVFYDLGDTETVVANHVEYTSFGKIAAESDPSITILFGFTGRERDDESDLDYFRARYYDTELAVFLSEDPIRDDRYNNYRYVANGPTNATDPSGLIDPALEEAARRASAERTWQLRRTPRGSVHYEMLSQPTLIEAMANELRNEEELKRASERAESEESGSNDGESKRMSQAELSNRMRLRDLQKTWSNHGFEFSAFLLQAFLDKMGATTTEQNPARLDRFGKIIDDNRTFTIALKDYLKKIVVPKLDKLFADGTLSLDDRDFHKPGDAAFHVEFAAPIIQANVFSDTGGTDLTWALGTGHFGYKNAKLTAKCVDRSQGVPIYEVAFSATMIQQDPYVFPGSWEREMFPDYKSAADLQRRFGYPTYYHREEWSIERKYKVAKLPNAAIYWVHDPIITR